MRLEFGEWTPDLIGMASSVVEAKNVIPSADGYKQFRAAASKTSALAAACLGAVWYHDKTNTAQTFAGTAAKLYKRSGDSWADVSDAGGYSCTRWEFTKWGDWCVGVNGGDEPQYIEMNAGAAFADLSGAPIAEHVATIRDFLVFGSTTESSVDYVNRIRWSGFNNATTYGSSLATQADYQDLLGAGGRVQRIVSGDVGIIFQERSIWTMEYVGPPTIFRFNEIEPGRGTPAPDSVCWMGRNVYYYSHDGFMAFDLASGSQPIGTLKVNQWFKDNLDPTRFAEIRSVVDRENRYVYWSFPSTSAGTTCDSILVYHTVTGRWSYAKVNTEIIFEAVSPGYTLDGLDSIFADIDSESIAVDSRAYLGGAVALGCFDTSHKMATFDGDALTAEIQTGESGEDGRAFITALRPLIVGSGTVTAQIGSRNILTENVSWGPSLSVNSAGQMTTRKNARYHRFKVSVAGGFDRMHGIEVTGVSEGLR